MPTTGLVGRLLGTLGTVGAATSLTSRIGLSTAGIGASVGSKASAAVNAVVAKGTVGVAASVNVGASVNASLPTVNSLFGIATELVDTVLSDVNSVLPIGASI